MVFASEESDLLSEFISREPINNMSCPIIYCIQRVGHNFFFEMRIDHLSCDRSDEYTILDFRSKLKTLNLQKH